MNKHTKRARRKLMRKVNPQSLTLEGQKS